MGALAEPELLLEELLLEELLLDEELDDEELPLQSPAELLGPLIVRESMLAKPTALLACS